MWAESRPGEGATFRFMLPAGLLRAAPAVGALCAAIVLTRRPIRNRAGRTLLTVVGTLLFFRWLRHRRT